jgi:hypothetical protein
MKTILTAILVVLVTRIALSAEPSYTPARIEALIQDGSAKEHGAAFANQGAGCRTYLWKDSANHHVFFFRRDGAASGEFRDEVLEDGRFLSIYERYLVVDDREPEALAKSGERRFVCKETVPVWRNKVAVEMNVRWSFLVTDRNGTTLRRGDATEKRMIRGVVSVVVPDDVAVDRDEFRLGLKRSRLTPHERAFGDERPLIEHLGPSNRRCSLWAQWPEDDPELIVTLNRKISRSPDDSSLLPFRLKEVASMKINLNPSRYAPFVFIPAE